MKRLLRPLSSFLIAVAILAMLAVATPAFAATPTISGFTPTSGVVGKTVTISGTGFQTNTTTAVKFNGTPDSSFAVNSDTKITAHVPAGATTGKINVVTSGGSVSSATKFIVLPAVRLSPTSGPPTASTTVSGTNFGTSEAVDVYFDTTDMALASTDGSGSFSGISVTVPSSALPGTHWVTAVGRHTGLSAQASFLVQTNWAQFRNTAKHRGKNLYENVLGPGNVSGMDVDWSYTTGSAIYSSPAVANGVVYVGSFDGKVYALNASTGAFLWSYTTGSYISSSPAVANGVVYVGSYDGKVYALNASTGAFLWSYNTTGGSISSSPAVANGVVYLGAADGKVYALNASTGAFLWSYTTPGVIYSSPAVANGVVYVGSADGKVYALNASTGAFLWSYTTPGVIESSPAVANGVVYVGSDDGRVYALNASTGAFLWSYTTPGVISSSPAVANGVVYVGSFDGKVYAFDLAGEIQAPARPDPESLRPDLKLRPSAD